MAVATRVGVVQSGPYVVRVAGKTTQRGMCCRASTEGACVAWHQKYCREAEGVCRRVRRVLPGTQKTAEKRRACVAMCRAGFGKGRVSLAHLAYTTNLHVFLRPWVGSMNIIRIKNPRVNQSH